VREEVVKRRREVNAAASTVLLIEKIKTEEVRPLTPSLKLGGMTRPSPQTIEMLEAFSTSPDKTVSLFNFEKMIDYYSACVVNETHSNHRFSVPPSPSKRRKSPHAVMKGRTDQNGSVVELPILPWAK
jgi:hypothetical protein